MNIVYYIDKDEEAYWKMLGMSMASVRKNVSFAHIVLQTRHGFILDKYFKDKDYTVDEYMNIDGVTHYPYWYNRILMNSRMKNTQSCFIDIDTLVLGDISDAFRYHNAEVIATTRYPHESGLPPLNWGVYFSQSDKFWKEIARDISPAEKYPELVLNRLFNAKLKVNEGSYDILPGCYYNRQVNSKTEEFPLDTQILHFKGQRKKYMEYYYNKLILGKEGGKDTVNPATGSYWDSIGS